MNKIKQDRVISTEELSWIHQVLGNPSIIDSQELKPLTKEQALLRETFGFLLNNFSRGEIVLAARVFKEKILAVNPELNGQKDRMTALFLETWKTFKGSEETPERAQQMTEIFNRSLREIKLPVEEVATSTSFTRPVLLAASIATAAILALGAWYLNSEEPSNLMSNLNEFSKVSTDIFSFSTSPIKVSSLISGCAVFQNFSDLLNEDSLKKAAISDKFSRVCHINFCRALPPVQAVEVVPPSIPLELSQRDPLEGVPLWAKPLEFCHSNLSANLPSSPTIDSSSLVELPASNYMSKDLTMINAVAGGFFIFISVIFSKLNAQMTRGLFNSGKSLRKRKVGFLPTVASPSKKAAGSSGRREQEKPVAVGSSGRKEQKEPAAAAASPKKGGESSGRREQEKPVAVGSSGRKEQKESAAAAASPKKGGGSSGRREQEKPVVVGSSERKEQKESAAAAAASPRKGGESSGRREQEKPVVVGSSERKEQKESAAAAASPKKGGESSGRKEQKEPAAVAASPKKGGGSSGVETPKRSTTPEAPLAKTSDSSPVTVFLRKLFGTEVSPKKLKVKNIEKEPSPVRKFFGRLLGKSKSGDSNPGVRLFS